MCVQRASVCYLRCVQARTQLEETTLADIGFRDLVYVGRDATVGDAVARMQAEEVGCCAVLDGTRLAGIFTERNLAARVFGAGLGLDAPIAACMTSEPVTARPSDKMHDVLARMRSGGFRHLPVVDDAGRPIGTTSIKRAIRLLGAAAADVVYNVPPEPGRYPAHAEGG
jgi:CBS domain-containing protein